MRYALRPADDSDKTWLEALRRAAHQDLFHATWGAWDEGRHMRHFSESWDRGHISIIEVGDGPVGMIQMYDTADSVEVGEIQVLPRFQNQGIGTTLLRDTIKGAHRLRKSVVLSLGLKNEGALRLYQALGFRESSRSNTHIHMWCPPAGTNSC